MKTCRRYVVWMFVVACAFQDAETPPAPSIVLEPPKASTMAGYHEVAVQGTTGLVAGTVIEIAVTPKSRSSIKTTVAVARATVSDGKFRETIRIPKHFVPGGYTATAVAKAEDQRGDLRRRFLKEFEDGRTVAVTAEFRIGELKGIEAVIVRESEEIVGQIRFIDALIEKSKEESPKFDNIDNTIRTLSEIFNRSAPGALPTLFPDSRACLGPAAIRGIDVVKQDPGKKPRVSNTLEPPARQEMADTTRQSQAALAGEYLALVAEETGFVKSSLKAAFETAVDEAADSETAKPDNRKAIWTSRVAAVKKDRAILESLLTRSHMTATLETRKGVAAEVSTFVGETLENLIKAWSSFVDGNRTDEAKEEIKNAEEAFDRKMETIISQLGHAAISK